MPDAPMGEWTVRQFLDAVASQDPLPGGGAVAALAGAGAAALLHMVASLALRRTKDPALVASLTAHREQACAQEQRFLDLAADDIAAYRGVTSALALPRSTPQEKAHRSAALHQALARAAEVPLATARLATDALTLAAAMAPFCPPVARSDLATAVHLARAAAEAGVANVDANALSLDDSSVRRELARARSEVSTAARAQAEAVLAPLEVALQAWLDPP